MFGFTESAAMLVPNASLVLELAFGLSLRAERLFESRAGIGTEIAHKVFG
jgi:hypothetical protein